MKKLTTLFSICLLLFVTHLAIAQEYVVQEIGYNPPNSNVQISTFLNVDDGYSDIIPIGFDFVFYENLYQHLVIGGNGVLNFDLSNANNQCPWNFIDDVPSVNFPIDRSVLVYHDMFPGQNPESQITYGTYGTAPNRRFVANFFEVSHFQCNNIFTTFQIVLYETTNNIEVYIRDKPACLTWNSANTVVGIINFDPTEGIAAPERNTSDSPWEAYNEAWRFSFFDGVTVEAYNANYVVCDTGNGGIETFDLELIIPEVAGNQSNVTVSFHETFDDANNDLNPLPTMYTNTTNPQLIYARVEDSMGLFATSEVTLEVINCIDEDGDTVMTADEDLNGDGYLGNDDTDNDGIPNYLDPDDDNDWVPTIVEVAGPDNEGSMMFDTDNDGLEDHLDNDDDNDGLLSTDEDYNNNGDPTDDDLNNNNVPDYLDDQVTVILTVTANPPAPIDLCDTPPFDGFAIFDLTITEAEIVGSQTGLDVTWYLTLADAVANTNAIANPTTYQNISNPQTIYARATDPGNGDFDTTNFTITVLPAPSPVSPTPFEICDDDGDGFAEFDLTQKDAEIVNGEPGVNVTYHQTLSDAQNDINALASPYTNTVPFNQIVFARVEFDSTGCATVVELELVVVAGPEVLPVSDLIVFDENGDGFEVFNLTEKIPEILGTQDPAQIDISFHLTLTGAANNTDVIANPEAYVNTSNPQTIYVRLEQISEGCFALNEFVIFADPDLGLNDNFSKLFSVVPNPTDGEIRLIPNMTLDGNLTLYDLQGREIETFVLTQQSELLTINLSGLVTGTYILKFESGETVFSYKILKK